MENTMLLKRHILLNIFIFLVQTQADKVMSFCYNSTLEGFRLNATVVKAIGVFEWIDCAMECVTDPCCRAVNFKKEMVLDNEKNCEMLHSVVIDTSEKLLERNSSYNHIYLLDPQKEYSTSCLSKDLIKKDEGSDEYRDQEMTDMCDLNSNCINTDISHQCQCQSGYSGDGNTCTALLRESKILEDEPFEYQRNLNEWLPNTGNWSICWRASTDGWDASTFHTKCDGKKPTLTIVKVIKNSDKYIFGGYATKSWAGSGGTSAPGSFLYSLRNNDDLPSFKAPLVVPDGKVAIHRSKSRGPTFGYGKDLLIESNAHFNAGSYTNFGYTYKVPPGYSLGSAKVRSLLAGRYKFTPSEVEVLFLSD